MGASIFLALPAELRIRVYELLFDSSLISIRTGPLLKRHGGVYAYAWTRTPGILLACKQTHGEAVHFYYELSTFASGWMPDLGNWLKVLPKSRQNQIRHLRYQEIDVPLFPLTPAKRETLSAGHAILLASARMYMGSLGVVLKGCVLETGHRFGHLDEISSFTVLST